MNCEDEELCLCLGLSIGREYISLVGSGVKKGRISFKYIRQKTPFQLIVHEDSTLKIPNGLEDCLQKSQIHSRLYDLLIQREKKDCDSSGFTFGDEIHSRSLSLHYKEIVLQEFFATLLSSLKSQNYKFIAICLESDSKDTDLKLAHTHLTTLMKANGFQNPIFIETFDALNFSFRPSNLFSNDQIYFCDIGDSSIQIFEADKKCEGFIKSYCSPFVFDDSQLLSMLKNRFEEKLTPEIVHSLPSLRLQLEKLAKKAKTPEENISLVIQCKGVVGSLIFEIKAKEIAKIVYSRLITALNFAESSLKNKENSQGLLIVSGESYRWLNRFETLPKKVLNLDLVFPQNSESSKALGASAICQRLFGSERGIDQRKVPSYLHRKILNDIGVAVSSEDVAFVSQPSTGKNGFQEGSIIIRAGTQLPMNRQVKLISFRDTFQRSKWDENRLSSPVSKLNQKSETLELFESRSPLLKHAIALKFDRPIPLYLSRVCQEILISIDETLMATISVSEMPTVFSRLRLSENELEDPKDFDWKLYFLSEAAAFIKSRGKQIPFQSQSFLREFQNEIEYITEDGVENLIKNYRVLWFKPNRNEEKISTS